MNKGERRELTEIVTELFRRCYRSARCRQSAKKSVLKTELDEMRHRFNVIIGSEEGVIG